MLQNHSQTPILHKLEEDVQKIVYISYCIKVVRTDDNNCFLIIHDATTVKTVSFLQATLGSVPVNPNATVIKADPKACQRPSVQCLSLDPKP
jgi:hypothetical protein